MFSCLLYHAFLFPYFAWMMHLGFRKSKICSCCESSYIPFDLENLYYTLKLLTLWGKGASESPGCFLKIHMPAPILFPKPSCSQSCSLTTHTPTPRPKPIVRLKVGVHELEGGWDQADRVEREEGGEGPRFLTRATGSVAAPLAETVD